jgi:hypothetical protein
MAAAVSPRSGDSARAQHWHRFFPERVDGHSVAFHYAFAPFRSNELTMRLLTLSALALSLSLASAPAAAQTVLALNNSNALLRFSAQAPGAALATVPVTGLNAGDSLVGIDVRPATGALFGLGSSGRLYTINPATGVATPGPQVSVALSGTSFGIDFNPVPDRLRVISNTGQNLRINVADGVAITDGAINPAGFAVTGAGYIENFAGTATTQLFNIDLTGSQLTTQNPPNAGTQVAVGPLGVALDAGSEAGFDVRTVGGVNSAFAALRVGGTTGFYSVNTTTGAATLVGPIAGNPVVRGMTLVNDSVLPAPPTTAVGIGLTTANTLVRFALATPGTILGSTPVTGLVAGETLLGIDVRPASGQLFGLSNAGRVYTINPVSGAATLRSTINVTLNATSVGMDFNPVPDRLRVITDTGQNLRINVDDGVTAVDGAVNPAGFQVAGAAYLNAVAGATSTSLLNLDVTGSRLTLQSPPNNGTQVALGALGVTIGTASGFDVLTTAGTDAGFAVLNVGGTTGLYRVDVSSGATTLVGAVGGNPTLVGLALLPTDAAGPSTSTAVPANSPWSLLLLGGLLVGTTLLLRRR